MIERIRTLTALGKARIALLSTLSAMAGFMLASHGQIERSFAMIAGVFLLACGSAAMNQYQDREMDALMERTRRRPIPSGSVSPLAALLLASGWMLAGLAVLLAGAGVLSAFLGLVAVVWYNAVYAGLKRVSAFAALPGSVVGAIPPVIGWVAGGGDVLAKEALALAFFFFIWQVPHFWILLLGHAGDYARTGLPSLLDVFSRRQAARLIFVWTAAAAAASFLIPFFGAMDSVYFVAALIAAGVLLTARAWKQVVRSRDEADYRGLFRNVNTYALLVIVLISLNSFWS